MKYLLVIGLFIGSLSNSYAQVPDDIQLEAFIIDESEIEGQSIYGKPIKRGPSKYDSRIEMHQLSNDFGWESDIIKNASAIGMIVEKEQLVRINENEFQIAVDLSLQERFGLCPGEAFANQQSYGIGTAFLIDSVTMCTAAHVFDRPLKRYYVVFDYQAMPELDANASIISAENVYELKSYVRKNQFQDYDVELFRLKRATNRDPLSLANEYEFKKNNFIYAIGHPLGISQKVSLNARILSRESNTPFFYTSLDAFQGNSGSPVFDFNNHSVIGILVSGEVDFIERGGCMRSYQCKPPQCAGEKIIKVSVLEQSQ